MRPPVSQVQLVPPVRPPVKLAPPVRPVRREPQQERQVIQARRALESLVPQVPESLARLALLTVLQDPQVQPEQRVPLASVIRVCLGRPDLRVRPQVRPA